MAGADYFPLPLVQKYPSARLCFIIFPLPRLLWRSLNQTQQPLPAMFFLIYFHYGAAGLRHCHRVTKIFLLILRPSHNLYLVSFSYETCRQQQQAGVKQNTSLKKYGCALPLKLQLFYIKGTKGPLPVLYCFYQHLFCKNIVL